LIEKQPNALRQGIVGLLGQSDSHFETIVNNLLKKENIKVAAINPVSKLWLKVVDGSVVLCPDRPIVESLMEALALGGTLMFERVMYVPYHTGVVKEDHRGQFADIARFAVMSPEVASSVAVRLINFTGKILGVGTGKPVSPVRLFRLPLSTVVDVLEAISK
jgi:hypothetical protein